MTEQQSSAATLAQDMAEAQHRYYTQDYHWSGEPASANWVTNLIHECEQYGLLSRRLATPRPEPRVLAMFSQGREIERLAGHRLTRDFGWTWTLQQLRVRWEQYDITGRIDGIVSRTERGIGVVAEIKGISGNVYPQIESEDDFAGCSYWRHRAIPWQLRLYLWMVAHGIVEQHEAVIPGEGLVILVDKASTELKPIAVHIDGYEDPVTEMLDKAARINAALANGQESLTRLSRPSVCSQCDYAPQCMPSLTYAAPLLAQDAGFVELLSIREKTEEARAEYQGADKEAKELLKGADWGESDMMVAGDFSIVRKVSKNGAQRFDITRHKEAVNERK